MMIFKDYFFFSFRPATIEIIVVYVEYFSFIWRGYYFVIKLRWVNKVRLTSTERSQMFSDTS